MLIYILYLSILHVYFIYIIWLRHPSILLKPLNYKIKCVPSVCLIHIRYSLLTHQYIIFWNLYYKQYGSRSDCSLRGNMIGDHSVCFHDLNSLMQKKKYFQDKIKFKKIYTNKKMVKIECSSQDFQWLYCICSGLLFQSIYVTWKLPISM